MATPVFASFYSLTLVIPPSFWLWRVILTAPCVHCHRIRQGFFFFSPFFPHLITPLLRNRYYEIHKESTYRTQQDAAFGVTKFFENIRPILKQEKCDEMIIIPRRDPFKLLNVPLCQTNRMSVAYDVKKRSRKLFLEFQTWNSAEKKKTGIHQRHLSMNTGSKKKNKKNAFFNGFVYLLSHVAM